MKNGPLPRMYTEFAAYWPLISDPFVDHGTNTKGDVSFTLLEYTWDPDRTDTTIECLTWYIIREGGKVRVEADRHVMGLFARSTWVRLMEEAGFAVDLLDYDVHEDRRQAVLFAGVLHAGRRPVGASGLQPD